MRFLRNAVEYTDKPFEQFAADPFMALRARA
jgi:hypothetical protein